MEWRTTGISLSMDSGTLITCRNLSEDDDVDPEEIKAEGMIFYSWHCESKLFTSRNLGFSTFSPKSSTAFDFATNQLYGPILATSTASMYGA